jgi:CheY-like chemotaxis protein
MPAVKLTKVKAWILHVDDDPNIRLMISASLREYGYVVATAGTTPKPWSWLKK